MAVETVDATLRLKQPLPTDNTPVAPTPVGTMTVTSTVEVSAAASAGSVYRMLRLPSGARIMGTSIISIDDLASAGAPTLDIGVAPVSGSLAAADPDAINDGIDAATAGESKVIKDRANYGKRLWELAGASADPEGMIDLTVNLVDAAANVGGTITVEVTYTAFY